LKHNDFEVVYSGEKSRHGTVQPYALPEDDHVGVLNVLMQYNYVNTKIVHLLVNNDIGLYETSLITSDILWYQIIPYCSS